MSLTVPPELVERARRDDLDDAAFVACIRTSLPYAWQVVEGLIGELRTDGTEFAANEVPPPDEAARGQLLRMLASDAMRGALERHYGVRLAFQNCHKVAVFHPSADEAYREFVTPRAQILNQRPELVDC
ncbi:MAG: SCO5389 family protein [Actinoallomurus sp.]